MTPILHYWNTPNGHKPVILLEELGVSFSLRPVDIGRGEQFSPAYTEICPNQKIPALTVSDEHGQPFHLFESGAILTYLADRHGAYLPAEGPPRYKTLQWLFWQVGGLGPMAGQNHHFQRYASETVPYAIARYVRETRRLYQVLERALEQGPWIAGDYSIADMAIYPWIVEHKLQQQNLADTPRLAQWFSEMHQRPAVQRAYGHALRLFGQTRAHFDARAHDVLFPAGSEPKAS